MPFCNRPGDAVRICPEASQLAAFPRIAPEIVLGHTPPTAAKPLLVGAYGAFSPKWAQEPPRTCARQGGLGAACI